MKVLVTGANGFVGSALCPHLVSEGCEVIPVVRRPSKLPGALVLSADDDAGWLSALTGCDSVVHLAGRAHVMQETTEDPLAAFREANVQASLTLAKRAARARVRRLVFMSTVKVNGEHTAPGACFRPEDVPAPQDPYAVSKWEAEQGLQQIAQQTGLELVVIRPPLVYGPEVKGNFAALVKMVQRGVPLPFGAVHNQRSMVGLDNLVSLVSLCANPATSPRAAHQVFLVSDGSDVSTTVLLKKVAHAFNMPSRLIPVPVSWMREGAKLLGKSDMADRLLGSLVVDDSQTRALLGWHPPISLDEQLQRMKHAASV